MMPSIAPPRIYTPLESVVVEPDGSTWVGLRRIATGNPWVVLSPRGDVVGTVIAPANVRVMAARGNEVWGTETDPDGLESVARYRVIGPGAR